MPEWSAPPTDRADAEKVSQAFDSARAEPTLSVLDIARLAPTVDSGAVHMKAFELGTLEVVAAATVEDGARLAEGEFWQRLILIGFLAGYQIGRETTD